jgi:hypothetical protein
MQDRPASGQGPLIMAIEKVKTIKDAGMPQWKQTMFVDHYFAECVLVGGARRAARIAIKNWQDKDILDFINIKENGFLWSANNSIGVDHNFWNQTSQKSKEVFEAATYASYHHNSGEPGFLNLDKLVVNNKDLKEYKDGAFIGSKKYPPSNSAKRLLSHLASIVIKKEYPHIVNPCVMDDTWILTDKGARQVKDLIGKQFKIMINNQLFDSTKEGFFLTGKKQVFEVITKDGYILKATENHPLLVVFKQTRNTEKTKWVNIADLKVGDKIKLNNNDGQWDGNGNFNEGWLIGSLIGDGTYLPNDNARLSYWGDNRKAMMDVALMRLNKTIKHRKDMVGGDKIKYHKMDVSSKGLSKLALSFDVYRKHKIITPKIENSSYNFYRGVLQGLFDADGCVIGNQQKGISIRLSQSNLSLLQSVQRMLLRMGINSAIYQNRHEAGNRKLPDGNGNLKDYFCKANHELVIANDNIKKYCDIVGFTDQNKLFKLKTKISLYKRKLNKDKFCATISEIKKIGIENVYDCQIIEKNSFDANGIIVHNCGEVSLNALNGYCVIADVVPYFAPTLDDAEEAFRVATRALIRVNTMDSLYKEETARTNRIGVGMTGIHEFAWNAFGYTFKDLINEEKSKDFWMTINRFKNAVVDEADKYSKAIGVNVPHTNTTMKPAGTTSKLFGLSEGCHLPAMKEYMRWVQFRSDDKLVKKYEDLGYPSKVLKSYTGTTIVGFPTQPEICRLGMNGELTLAGDATPEEQYQWLMLLEKYWIVGLNSHRLPLKDTGNQISYTLKYKKDKVSFLEFKKMLLQYQSQIKCCAVMPQQDSTIYEYQPEESISKGKFLHIIENIKDTTIKEDVDMESLRCESGACPI